MHKTISFLTLLIAYNCIGQSNFDEAMTMAYELKTPDSRAYFQQQTRANPMKPEGYYGIAWTYLTKGITTLAKEHCVQALAISPSYGPAYFLMGHKELLEWNDDQANDFYKQGLLLITNKQLDQIYEGIDAFIKRDIHAERFKKIREWIKNQLQSRDIFLVGQFEKLNNAENLISSKKPEQGIAESKAIIAKLEAQNSSDLYIAEVYHRISQKLYDHEYFDASIRITKEAIAWPNFGNVAEKNSFLTSVHHLALCQYYLNNGKADKAAEEIDRIINPKGPTIPGLTLEGLHMATLISGQVETMNPDDYMFLLRNLAEKEEYEYYKALAYNHIAMYYMLSSDPSEQKMVTQLIQKAMESAQKSGVKPLETSLKANYAITLFRDGNEDDGIVEYHKLIKIQLENGQILDAELSLNNMGSMLWLQEKYEKAAKAFQEAVELSELKRSEIKPLERQEFLAAQISAYDGMVACYAKLQNTSKAFEAMELQRSRTLSETLSEDHKTITLQDFQSSLNAEEAAIYYNIMAPGEVVILAITKDQSKVLYHKDIAPFNDLRNRYVNKIKGIPVNSLGFELPTNYSYVNGIFIKNDEVESMLTDDDLQITIDLFRELLNSPGALPKTLDELERTFYKFTLQPIESILNSKKKWLISPNNQLSFLPFETFKTPGGTQVITDHDVRYFLSASVSNLVSKRVYPTDRKSLLAMGGATYAEMAELAFRSNSPPKTYELHELMMTNIKEDNHQREIFAALGFGKMNYLKGTLLEVQAIAEIVPETEKHLGENMTEAKIKEMSSQGTLDDFKVIHLATHGYALEILPELSGVAMCIFEKPQNNQDGYLTSYEIAQLKLKADLVVLSACETGLGEYVGGEGINGLTRSLILAGANRTLVSLWPVSDQATMMYMAGLYELVFKHDFSYVDATNDMKRRFSSGEFGEAFTHPSFWAPFITYGN